MNNQSSHNPKSISLGDLNNIDIGYIDEYFNNDTNTIDLHDFTFNLRNNKGDVIDIDTNSIGTNDISIIEPNDDVLSIISNVSDFIFENFSDFDVIEINDGDAIIIDTSKKKKKIKKFETPEDIHDALHTFILVPDISTIKFSEFIRYFRIEKNGRKLLRCGGLFVKDTITHIFLRNYGRIWRVPKKTILNDKTIVKTPFYVRPGSILKDGRTIDGIIRVPKKGTKKYENIIII
jgi:hypothetical protein